MRQGSTRPRPNLRGEEEIQMITWVLAEEPTEEVAVAIEIVEARLGSTEEVMWVCPTDIVEPATEL
jgi:hypothetical protein